MMQKGRMEYVREIGELQDRLASLESELATYDRLYKEFFDALPRTTARGDKRRAVNRAMADAFVRWEDDESI